MPEFEYRADDWTDDQLIILKEFFDNKDDTDSSPEVACMLTTKLFPATSPPESPRFMPAATIVVSQPPHTAGRIDAVEIGTFTIKIIQQESTQIRGGIQKYVPWSQVAGERPFRITTEKRPEGSSPKFRIIIWTTTKEDQALTYFEAPTDTIPTSNERTGVWEVTSLPEAY